MDQVVVAADRLHRSGQVKTIQRPLCFFFPRSRNFDLAESFCSGHALGSQGSGFSSLTGHTTLGSEKTGSATKKGATMNTYNVTLKYEDRKVGPEGRTIKVDASSIAGAIGKATREFVKSLDRKQRFDMNKGLKIEALRVTTEKAESPAASEAGV